MTMTRRTFVSAAASATASAASAATLPPAPAQAARRRNIVFILVDDQRYDMAGALGHPWIKTPHIDRLCQSGVVFENAFVTSSLCSPSRASLLTGLYQHTHRVMDNFSPLNPALPTFPQILQKQGYRTAFLGKWHMGGASDEPRPGFDHWISFFGQGEYLNAQINENGRQRRIQGYLTDFLTGEAERFIRRERERPFCLYLSHKAIHYPFQAAPRHETLYANERVPYPQSMVPREEWLEQWPDWVRRRRNSRQGVDGLFGQTGRFDDFYKGYCRALAPVDESVGRVMAALEETGLANDTLVIYMGDNGYMWGEHGLIDKRAQYEASIRVPMIAHCPDLTGPGRRKEFALNLDIAPTLLEAAGAPAPPKLHGRSLLPLLRGPAADWRTEFLYEYEWERDFPYTPTILGLRTERYSLMQYYGLWDLDELYDIQKDPEQLNNLLGRVRVRHRGRMAMQIQDKQLKELVAGLQTRIAKLLAATGGDPRLAGEEVEGAAAAL